MKKPMRTLTFLMAILILTTIYKVIPDMLFQQFSLYQKKMIEEGLQLITIVGFITVLGLWTNVGSLAVARSRHLVILLPVALLSFVPLLKGFRTDKVGEIIMILLISVFIGISEELACRGVIYSAFYEKGRLAAIVGSSALFGVLHFMNLLKGASLEDTLIQVVFATGFGLVMAVLRDKTGMIMPQILIHSLWDFNSKVSNGNYTNDLYPVIFFTSLALVVVWGSWLLFRTWQKQKTLVGSSGAIF